MTLQNKMHSTGEGELFHDSASSSSQTQTYAFTGEAYPPDFPGLGEGVELNSFYLPLIVGQPDYVEDLFTNPNILIAGTIGTGKTQFIYNQLLTWFSVRTPSDLKLIICGSKLIDYQIFEKLDQHFLIVDGLEKIHPAAEFKSLIGILTLEIDKRVNLFLRAGVKNIKDYNKEPASCGDCLPDLVLIIDDLYDYILNEDFAILLADFAAKTLNTGIFIIAATSQINSNNISKRLKANFSFRIAFKLMSHSDSRKILDIDGAEHLAFPGNVLFYWNGRPTSSKQPFIDYSDVKRVVTHISLQSPAPRYYLPHEPEPETKYDYGSFTLDPMFADAARLIVLHQQGSTSLIQRKLKINYNRAGRLIDQLEACGVVGPFEGSKPREVLLPDEYALEQFLDNLFTFEESSNIRKKVTVVEPPTRTLEYRSSTANEQEEQEPETVEVEQTKPGVRSTKSHRLSIIGRIRKWLYI